MLTTPESIRTLQRKLYRKAKQEPAYRFYLLYDKVYRADILAHAYALSKQHRGAPGVDGVTFENIEAAGVERWLAAVQEGLQTEAYRAQPVRRVLIPKPGGGARPLGIPTIRDRVVQTAAVLILQPIFEADLEPTAYGYRPGRTAGEAVQEVHRALCAGHTEVIDADVRNPRAKRNPFDQRQSDQQRTDETRTIGHGDAVEIVQRDARLVQRAVDDGQNAADMLARRQLRNHAAVRAVHFILR